MGRFRWVIHIAVIVFVGIGVVAPLLTVLWVGLGMVGSWPWALLNFVRTALLLFFIDNNQLWALAVSGAFFYALTIGTVVWSWFIIKRSLPADHPGIRHPRWQDGHQ